MKTTAIAVINGQQIQISNDEQQLVPIKPICMALGVGFESQVNKIKEHRILSSTISLGDIVAADGKRREMLCMPLRFVYGWLLSISAANVSEEVQDSLIRYQLECYNALYDHFNRSQKRIAEENRAEIEALEDIARLTQEIGEGKRKLSAAKKRLETIRAGRLDPQPVLF